MKTSRKPFTLPAVAVLSAILPALASTALAQTPDTSTGEVGNSSSSASTPPPANPEPTRLVAKLVPAGPDSKAAGQISFSLAGDGLSVSGRLDGLEPSSRYQLAVPPAVTSAEEKEVPAKEPASDAPQPPKKTENPAPAAGAPVAGEPNAGGPEAGRPEAGQPDGTYRPGPGGGGSHGTGISGSRASSGADMARRAAADSAKASGAMGILTADAEGGTTVNLLVRSMALTTGPDGLQGRTVTLTKIPAAGAATAPVLVAGGLLEIPRETEEKP